MHEVSDMAIRVRNALQRKRSDVILKNTKLSQNIATVLKEEGFIEDFQVIQNVKSTQDDLKIILKYIGKKQKPSLTHFQPVSKPSLRVYRSTKALPRVLGGMGVTILSTPKGVLTQNEAKAQGVGGEILCYVW